MFKRNSILLICVVIVMICNVTFGQDKKTNNDSIVAKQQRINNEMKWVPATKDSLLWKNKNGDIGIRTTFFREPDVFVDKEKCIAKDKNGYYRGETLLTDDDYTNDPDTKAIIEKDKKLKNKKK